MMASTQAMAAAILGVWIGVTVSMWVAATGSFTTVNRVLRGSNPQFGEAAKPLAPGRTRLLLRLLAWEINRTYFNAYGWVQAGLGALLLWLLVRQTPRDRLALALAGAMFPLVLSLAFVLAPQIVALGRALDFVPRNPPPREMGRFGMLHGLYAVLDGAKLLDALFLAPTRVSSSIVCRQSVG